MPTAVTQNTREPADAARHYAAFYGDGASHHLGTGAGRSVRMGGYRHSFVDDQFAAVNRLPKLAEQVEAVELKPTGTDN